MSRGKYMLIALVALLVLPAAHAQAIRVIVNGVQPQPVEPGNDITLGVTYGNFNNDYIQKLSAQVDLKYPFSLKSSTESFDNGFELCGFCSRTNSYFIRVDPSAKSGIYPIFIRLSGNGSDTAKTVNVSVMGKPNIVLATDAVVNATPSNHFIMKLNVSNIGTGAANELKITSKSSEFISLGSSVAVISSMSPGNASMAVFDMSPDDQLKAGSYNIPFDIEFKDETGIKYNISQNIGVRVVNDALLNIESIKVSSGSGAPVAGQPFTAIVRLENVGHGNADAIEAQISCNGQSSKSFLGQLKRDEDAPAVFDLTLPSGGAHECLFVANYTDDTGSKSISRKFDITLKNPDFPLGIAALVVIIILALYFWRKRGKKKKAGA